MWADSVVLDTDHTLQYAAPRSADILGTGGWIPLGI